MANKALLVWCVASLAACGTAALATTALWRSPPAEPVPAFALDLPMPELPPETLAGLDPASLGADAAPTPALPVFVTMAGLDVIASVPDQAPLRSEPAPGTGTLAEVPAAGRGFAEVVASELSARDPRLAVRPPPRPGFLIARLDAAPRSGIADNAAPPSGGEVLPGFETPTPAPLGSIADLFGAPDPGRRGFGRPLQAGMASWYGPGFHGRKTASGEVFNQNDLTAAHRSLPFGTRVRVVDEKTGRSIVVRINDRGPFAHGRIIDLSKASAQALGMGGTSRVKLVSAN